MRMPKGLAYKTLSKERIAELKAGELSEGSVLKALKAGEFNNARCEDFSLTSGVTENIHLNNFVWKRGKFRGKFFDCIFSDGRIEEIDFWSSRFKNVIFKNIEFIEGEMNSSYSTRYLFELDNVIFENCTFNRFKIGQAINSKIYLKNCRVMDSGFYLKSSYIEFNKCSTEHTDKKGSDNIRIRMLEPNTSEPIKIQNCDFFGLNLWGDAIDILTMSAKGVYLNFSFQMRVKDLRIYCEYFRFDTKLYLEKGMDEIRQRYAAGLPPIREFENIEILCSRGGVFGFFGFKINNLKIAMAEERPRAGSAIFYSEINHLELVGIKTDVLRLDRTTVHKATMRSCHFHHLKLVQSVIPELRLKSVEISKSMILKKTKIGHLNLERVSIDKKAAWETELSAVVLVDKPDSHQEVKNVSGQALRGYFDRTDVKPLE